jgi:hypothetical protein
MRMPIAPVEVRGGVARIVSLFGAVLGQRVGEGVPPQQRDPLLQYKQYFSLLCLDFALTPELTAVIRRMDPRPFPFFAVYAVEGSTEAAQYNGLLAGEESAAGQGRERGGSDVQPGPAHRCLLHRSPAGRGRPRGCLRPGRFPAHGPELGDVYGQAPGSQCHAGRVPPQLRRGRWTLFVIVSGYDIKGVK